MTEKMSRFVILGYGIVIASEEQRGALFLSSHRWR